MSLADCRGHRRQEDRSLWGCFQPATDLRGPDQGSIRPQDQGLVPQDWAGGGWVGQAEGGQGPPHPVQGVWQVHDRLLHPCGRKGVLPGISLPRDLHASHRTPAAVWLLALR